MESLIGKRALVCEDAAIIQLQLVRLLRKAGMSVVGQAFNGGQAVEIALKERPELILMDIDMPIMDGLSAAKTILDAIPTCIVVFTAYAGAIEEAKALGVRGYILKPASQDEILPTIEAAFNQYWHQPHP